MKKIMYAAILFLLAAVLFGCTTENGMTGLVSEYKSEIYTAQSDGATLQASFSEREYPYAADGVVSDKSEYFEIRATLPDNTLTYTVSFAVGGKEYGGEMNYDSVKQQFTFSQSIKKPQEEEIAFTVAAEGENAPVYALTAKRLAGERIGLTELLEKVCDSQKEIFTQFSGTKFEGEIYVRLMVHQDKPYYYIGFIDKSGNCLSFLADAASGEVLASRLN